MDALLNYKITDEDIKRADEQVDLLSKKNSFGIKKEVAFAIIHLNSDYKHKFAAMRLSKKKGDLMYQKQMQYEESINERLKELFKNQAKGD
jgi:lysine/ornithine N-monooxygenase